MKKEIRVIWKDATLLWALFLLLLLPILFHVTEVFDTTVERIVYLLLQAMYWLFIANFITNFYYSKFIRYFDDGQRVEAIPGLNLLFGFFGLLSLALYILSVIDLSKHSLLGPALGLGLLMLVPKQFELIVGDHFLLYGDYILNRGAIRHFDIDLRGKKRLILLTLRDGQEITFKYNEKIIQFLRKDFHQNNNSHRFKK